MKRIMLYPLAIAHANGKPTVPLGDAILSLPLVKEGNFRMFAPQKFLADLLSNFAEIETADVVEKDDILISPATEAFKKENPFSIYKWGLNEFIKEHGPMNATLCWAAIIEMHLQNPVPHIARPCEPKRKKVGLFPSGSVSTRSLQKAKAEEIFNGLKKAGFSPEICRHFDNPEEFVNFIGSCEYVVGVYTGPVHLAAAMGVKTVALPVGDSALAYRPLQENVCIICCPCDRCWTPRRKNCFEFECNEAIPRCQRVVSLERVLDAFQKLDANDGCFTVFKDEAGIGTNLNFRTFGSQQTCPKQA